MAAYGVVNHPEYYSLLLTFPETDTMHYSLRIALLAAAISGAAFAASTALNVKPGAWELTVKTTVNGNTMPASVLAQMPAAQRAKILASMQARSGKTTSHVFKECLTPEDIQDSNAFSHDNEKACKKTVIAATSTLQKYKIVCGGDNPNSGTASFSAPSPTQIIGSIDMTQNAGGAKIHVEETGRWLGASCAGIKD
jgi:hypothetical protein